MEKINTPCSSQVIPLVCFPVSLEFSLLPLFSAHLRLLHTQMKGGKGKRKIERENKKDDCAVTLSPT